MRCGPFLTLIPVITQDQLGLRAAGYRKLLPSFGVGGLLVARPISQAANKGRIPITAGLAAYFGGSRSPASAEADHRVS